MKTKQKDNQDEFPELEKLSEHKPALIGAGDCMKSAVCIPLLRTEQGYSVLFEVRSQKILHQPGDVCFPGGMLEPGETPKEAAVREMMEELLITRDQFRVFGLMDVLYTGHRLMMYPYAAALRNYEGTYSKEEVEEVFTVPLEFFLNTQPDVYRVEAQIFPGSDFPYELVYGGKEYQWRKRREDILFYQYGGHVIWGLTAKIMKSFAEIYLQIISDDSSKRNRVNGK